MCGHVFLCHDSYSLQRHRPVWQCGTCGRVSSVPLDCCTRPDFARPHPAGLMHLLGQWVSGFGRWTRARWRPLWRWQRQPAISIGTTHATESASNMIMIASFASVFTRRIASVAEAEGEQQARQRTMAEIGEFQWICSHFRSHSAIFEAVKRCATPRKTVPGGNRTHI